ncbi:urea ABC transporter permease subunit UrtC [Gordonia sp. Z-3]|uniref:urea ABC transporter permease subunit UrtC n=1 Tax=Gordonia sp. Z-3 TaxID=3115408 RepID=UPI002E2D9755|nr:urea ABC transporter permease subunit UrtC [Gordonia sp. Z-3]MED5803109.1 urea ABC transporter permease subunit UrtC [Gordonia sp. Z-3]
MNTTLNSHTRTLLGFGLGVIALFLVAPLALSDYNLGLLAKFLCFGLVAIGIGLAWGRGGMLTLGQGVFFGLGAYMMAMHLKLADAKLAGSSIPDFLRFGGASSVPWFWSPFGSGLFTVLAVVAIPAAVAGVLGVLVFKRRVKGAYFAILSQALAAAFAVFLVGQQSLGSSNGINNFTSFFGYDLADPVNRRMLFFIIAGLVLVALAAVRQLMRSRYGELLVAIRDQEERVRFLGYDPANAKVGAFVFAAVCASVAGAMFVPIVGIISPTDVGVVPSIAFLIGVAIGGRSTLLGPLLGAVGVAWAQSFLSDSFPEAWTYLQGLLFIAVIGFFPAGIAGLGVLLRRRRHFTPAHDTTDMTVAADEPTKETAR